MKRVVTQTRNTRDYRHCRCNGMNLFYFAISIGDGLADVEDFAIVVNISVVSVGPVVAREGGL